MQTKNSIAYLYLVITFFCWGSNYVAAKFIMDAVPVTVLCAMRMLIAAIAFFFMVRKDLSTPIDKADRKDLFLVGFLGYFVTVLLNYTGAGLAGASLGALVNSLNPVSISIIAAIVLKEKLTPLKGLCLALAIAGAVVITWGSSGQGVGLGVLLVLGSVLSWGFASTLLRRLTTKYKPLLITFYAITISLIFNLPCAAVSIIRHGTGFSGPALLAIVYIGLVCTVVAHSLWSKSLSMLEAGRCSLFYPLQALFSVLLGRIFLQEQLSAGFFLGAAFIVADLALNFYDLRPRHSSALAPAPRP